MKLYMSRMVISHRDAEGRGDWGISRNAAELAVAEGIIKKMPDWSDFIRPQIIKEAAPERTTGW